MPVSEIVPQHRCRNAPDPLGALARPYLVNVQKVRGVARKTVPKDVVPNGAGPARDPPCRGRPSPPLVTAASKTTIRSATMPRLGS